MTVNDHQLVEMLWPTQALEAATHHNGQPGNDYQDQMWVDMIRIKCELRCKWELKDGWRWWWQWLWVRWSWSSDDQLWAEMIKRKQTCHKVPRIPPCCGWSRWLMSLTWEFLAAKQIKQRKLLVLCQLKINLLMALMVSHIFLLAAGSTPVVGSSNSITFGLTTSHYATCIQYVLWSCKYFYLT